MELMPESQKAEEVISNDPNAEYITVSRLSDDIVQLVQGSGGQIQEVHLTDDDGNIREIAYTYATQEGEAIPTLVSSGDLPKDEETSTFEYYDNARGKVNTQVLSKLAAKHNVDDPSVSKIVNQSRWSNVINEYNITTNQSKSRAVLMKKWSTMRPKKADDQKASTPRIITKKEIVIAEENVNDPDAVKKSTLVKQLKIYDNLRIEAAQFERNARKLEMENAALENESLRKENTILDLHLEAAKLELTLMQKKIREQ